MPLTGRRGSRRRAHHSKGQGSRKKPAWLLVLQVGLILAVLVLLTGSVIAGKMVMDALKAMPTITNTVPQPNLSSEIFDAKDKEKPLRKIYLEQNRELVDLKNIPDFVQNAFIAVEDKNFWTHRGVDLLAIMRAVYNDLRNRPLQGASTITQQLARNAFPIGSERSLNRKVQEAFLAIELERRFTKKQILEMYLQTIYFGQDAYGLESASQTYFSKPARDLSLVEGALLAGLPQAPSLYEPFGNPDAAKKRRNMVLDMMARNGFITEQVAEKAKEQPVKTVRRKKESLNTEGGHFIDYVLANLLQEYPARQVYQGGLKIETTLDRDIQKAAEKAVAEHMDKEFPLDQGKEQPQVALVVLENETGYIKAMVGGRKHSRTLELNRAWYNPEAGCCARQPGSAFKPLAVYIPALTNGYTAASVIDDWPVTYKTPTGAWMPRNYDHRYKGLTTLRESVRRSVNTVAVKLLDEVGVKEGYLNAARMGITTLIPTGEKNDANLSIALGGLTKGASVLDMARAYAAIANGGNRVEPIAITRITDSNGNLIKEYLPKRTQVVKPEVAYLMTDILRSVVEPQPGPGWISNWGTGSSAKPKGWKWPVAGKTGTTSDMKDVWFVGYTPRYTMAVWIGYDNATKADSLPKSITSSKHPAWIWRDVMEAAHKGLQPRDFPKPRGFSGFTVRKISVKSGKLAGPDTPAEWTRQEVFIPGTEPKKIDDIWVKATVCKERPEVLYAEACGCYPVEKIFLNRPPVAPLIDKPEQVPEDMALAVPQKNCLDEPLEGGPVEPGSANGDETGQDPGQNETPGTQTNNANGDSAQAGSILEVTLDMLHLAPPVLKVKQSRKVTLIVQGSGEGHVLQIRDLGLTFSVTPDVVNTFEFTPPKAGVYLIDCTTHPSEVGRLIVTP